MRHRLPAIRAQFAVSRIREPSPQKTCTAKNRSTDLDERSKISVGREEEPEVSGDITRAIAANTNGAALDRRADQLARSYGLTRCVRAATPPSSTTTTTVAAG